MTQVGLLQIDSVNVLAARPLPAAVRRLGPYDAELLDRARLVRAAAAVRVLGARGVAAAGRAAAAAALAHGSAPHDDAWGGMRRVAEERPELVERVLDDGAASGARSRRASCRATRRPRRRSCGGTGRDTKRALEFLFWRAGHLRAAARVRAPLRPARAGAAARRCWPRRRPRPTDAQRELVRIAARALGVAPSATCATTSGCRWPTRGRASPSWSRPASCCRSQVEGWGSPAYLWHEARAPAPRRRARADRPVRLADLGALARRAAVRLPLPDRDLHARAEAGARLLRAAVPARRPAGRPGRPQGRPGGGRAARAGGARRAGAPARDDRAAATRASELRRDGRVAGPGAGQSRTSAGADLAKAR